jgi:hypothetical protein
VEILELVMLELHKEKTGTDQHDGHSKLSTADKFGIEPEQLHEWINNKEKVLNVP